MFDAYGFNLVLKLRGLFLIWQFQIDQDVNQKHCLFRIKLRFRANGVPIWDRNDASQ